MSSHNIPAGWQRLEFGTFAQRSKARFNPVGAVESRMCIELEHIDQQTGQLLGSIDSASQASIKSVFEPQQVLFGKLRPYLQKYWLADKPGVCTSEIWVLIANPQICTPEYLFYLVQSPEFIRACGVTSGSKMPRADWDLVAQYPLLVPALDQQPRITETLHIWDEAIALQTRQLQQLRRRKDKLYTELLSGSSRLQGFTQKWEQSTLGAYFAERVERGNTELPLLAITANQGIIHRDTLEKRDTSNEDKSKYKRIRVGDIGYNTMRMWQGVSSLSTLDGIVSPAYTILRPLTNCDAGFMAHFFKWSPMVHRFWRHSQGLVDDTLLCKYDSFKTVPATVPAVEEQRAIADVLNTAEAEIRLHERKLEALREQKRGLLQQLLTGEILLS
jgi:type I restriction enzyme S subunit